jgi:hypothetical protein
MNRRSLEFHIRSDDYFGSLATLLDLARQDIERRGYNVEDEELLVTLVRQLVHLQENYKIIRKTKARTSFR